MTEVVILSDNKVINLRPQGLKAEWGFSALIKAKDVILFDTGQTGVALDNLLVLKEEKPSKVVLSHGHYDHTGGLINFLRSFDLKIYTHPDAFLPRWYKGDYIGIPFQRNQIESYAEVIEHSDPIEVCKDVIALGEIPRKYESALLSDSFVLKGEKKVDEIKDDQSLVIKTKEGLALVLGCCHSGLRNTVEYAEDVVGDEVRFILGGTHLIAFKGNKLLEILDWIERFEWIAPCHCTGLMNELILKERLGDRCKIIGAGSRLKL